MLISPSKRSLKDMLIAENEKFEAKYDTFSPFPGMVRYRKREHSQSIISLIS